MKPIALIFSTLLLHFLLFENNNELNREITSNGRTYLYGEVNRQGLSQGQYGAWFNHRLRSYELDKNILAQLSQSHLANVEVKLLMATWCGDSKRNVPVFYKFANAIGLKEANIQTWALDLRKKGPDQIESKYRVTRVPTIIFYRNGKEIGRFIERPKKDQRLEQLWTDILKTP